MWKWSTGIGNFARNNSVKQSSTSFENTCITVRHKMDICHKQSRRSWDGKSFGQFRGIICVIQAGRGTSSAAEGAPNENNNRTK